MPDHPPAPPGTEALFGDGWQRAQEYVRLLCTEGVVRGVIGPREISRIWTRHIRNSLTVAPLLPHSCTAIDLGSGGGLPGIPVALARPDLRITLLDGMRRRIDFLLLARDTLGLHVDIEHARAEAATCRARYVICRAVAAAAQLLPLAHRLVDGRGELIALKGQSAPDEVAALQELLKGPRRVGWAPSAAEVVNVNWPDPAIVFRARWRHAGQRDPRRRPIDRGTDRDRQRGRHS